MKHTANHEITYLSVSLFVYVYLFVFSVLHLGNEVPDSEQ